VTGKIEVLGTDGRAGLIRAEDGVKVSFRMSEVAFEDDASDVAAGQRVTFDMERGRVPRAFNIHVENRHYRGQERDKLWQSIRYLDYNQSGNIRDFQFERHVPNGGVVRAIVSADLSLFSEHKVGIQDGPMLCLRLVMAELESSNATEESPFRRSLTDQDMLYHLASRRVPEKKRFGRRPTASTSFPPNHGWRGTAQRTKPS
jgi:cold shock CspA family protein